MPTSMSRDTRSTRRRLDAGWKLLAERLVEAGPAALNADKLGALGEPKCLAWLRGRVEKMLPKIAEACCSRAGVSVRSRPDHSDTGRHSARRSTMPRQARREYENRVNALLATTAGP